MRGRSVSDSVRVNRFCFNGRTLILGSNPVFFGDIADPETSDGSAIGIKKQVLNFRLFWGALLYVSLKSSCRFLFYLNDKFLIILNWKRIEIKYCKL